MSLSATRFPYGIGDCLGLSPRCNLFFRKGLLTATLSKPFKHSNIVMFAGRSVIVSSFSEPVHRPTRRNSCALTLSTKVICRSWSDGLFSVPNPESTLASVPRSFSWRARVPTQEHGPHREKRDSGSILSQKTITRNWIRLPTCCTCEVLFSKLEFCQMHVKWAFRQFRQ